MMSAKADNMELFRRMHDINTTTIPLSPFDLIAVNRWQISTYQMFSQTMGMSVEEMEQQISPRGFTFYSFTNKGYSIIYNSSAQPERIQFVLAHEIGHIFYGHVSPNIPLMCFEDCNKIARDKLADQFARFILNIS